MRTTRRPPFPADSSIDLPAGDGSHGSAFDGAVRWGSASLGAIMHGFMSLKATLARRLAPPPPPPRYTIAARRGDMRIERREPPRDEPPAVFQAAYRPAAPLVPRPPAGAPAAAHPASSHAGDAAARLPTPAVTPAVTPTVAPTWQRPFSLPPNVRFTRTPDHVLRLRAKQAAEAAEQAARAAAPSATETEPPTTDETSALPIPAGAEPQPVPIWQRPFVLPPNASFTRTPDHVLRERRKQRATEPEDEGQPAAAAAEEPAAPTAEVPASGIVVPFPLPARSLDTDDRMSHDMPADGPAGDPIAEEAAEPEDATPSSPAPLPSAVERILRHLPTEARPPACEQDNDLLPASVPLVEDAESTAVEAEPTGPGAPVNASAASNDNRPGLEEPRILALPTPLAAAAARPSAGAAPTPPTRDAAVVHAAPRSEASRRRQAGDGAAYELPPLELLSEPLVSGIEAESAETLKDKAVILEQVLADFGVRGEIINVRPGPVVTLYELEPAP
ncbi:DNA translocase FtsK, partial [Chelatococcus sp. SYSU_G07232]